MLKELFSTAALLVPCIAYGADPRLRVAAPGSAQSAPAGAVAAGFTTLALNSDFTKQLRPNWLGGCPVAGSGVGVTRFNADNTGHT